MEENTTMNPAVTEAPSAGSAPEPSAGLPHDGGRLSDRVGLSDGDRLSDRAVNLEARLFLSEIWGSV